MTREIKFRAWNEDVKRMMPCMEFAEMLKLEKQASGDWNPKNILMQYTGIKDKQGKEIYEGDVVKIKDDGYWYHDKFTTGIVVYESPEFVFKHIDDQEDVYSVQKFMNLGNGTGATYPKSRHPKFNVLGNIYKNPELLESNKLN